MISSPPYPCENNGLGDSEGAPLSATGLSSATPIEPVPVSPVPASIPSAADGVNHRAWAENAVTFIRERGLEREFQDWCGGWPCPIKSDECDALTITSDGALRRVASQIRHRLSDMELRQNVSWPASAPAAKTSGYVISEVADWQLRQWLAIIDNVAQAIEARRAETHSGSVHESAVGETDAPKGVSHCD